MSVTTTERPRPTLGPTSGETRILVPDTPWSLYASFIAELPERTPIRVAFDGKNMEIMVKGPVHDQYADMLDQFIKAVAGELRIRIKPMRETTWKRPEIERGIEADNCYYLDPVKIEAAHAAIQRRSNDVKDYPNPDLVIEIDISPSQADRMSIYAAMEVAEVWRFDGQTLTIDRLGADGRYGRSPESGFLPIRADQVPHWLLHEDLSDYGAWNRRVREWARNERQAE